MIACEWRIDMLLNCLMLVGTGTWCECLKAVWNSLPMPRHAYSATHELLLPVGNAMYGFRGIAGAQEGSLMEHNDSISWACKFEKKCKSTQRACEEAMSFNFTKIKSMWVCFLGTDQGANVKEKPCPKTIRISKESQELRASRYCTPEESSSQPVLASYLLWDSKFCAQQEDGGFPMKGEHEHDESLRGCLLNRIQKQNQNQCCTFMLTLPIRISCRRTEKFWWKGSLNTKRVCAAI